jgi:prolyl oligopeptidase
MKKILTQYVVCALATALMVPLAQAQPPGMQAASARDAGTPPAPVARVEVVKDTYFGETVSDPYRWMEISMDPDWLPFL